MPYLFSLCVVVDANVEPVSEIKPYMKFLQPVAVHISKSLKYKKVRCMDAYLEQNLKVISVFEELALSVEERLVCIEKKRLTTRFR